MFYISSFHWKLCNRRVHPQSQRLIYRVLNDFAGYTGDSDAAEGTDQILYSTHSPVFVDIGRYERVAIIRKRSELGTIAQQCEPGILGSIDEREGFKLLTCFSLRHNELFFANDCILVEGAEDEIGIIATARKLNRIIELPDEIGLSIVVTDGKGDMPKFQRILNAFGLRYGVLLELDGKSESDNQTAPIIANLNGNRIAKVPNRLEDVLGVGRHFDGQLHAKRFFSDPNNINSDMEAIVESLLPQRDG